MITTKHGHKFKTSGIYYMTSYAKVKGRSSKKQNQFKKSVNGNTFSMMRHDVVHGKEIERLSLAAKWVLMKMIGFYSKGNNGDLSAPLNKSKEIFQLSAPGLKKALDELISAEFLEVTRQGGKNQCSLYALTCFPLNDVNKAGIALKATDRPSDKWKKSF